MDEERERDPYSLSINFNDWNLCIGSKAVETFFSFAATADEESIFWRTTELAALNEY